VIQGGTMPNRIIPAIVISLMSCFAYAGEYSGEQCIKAVARVDSESSQPSKHNVKNFLDSLMSKTCQRNIEYLEWSNEAAYNLMRKSPVLIFSAIRESSAEIKSKIIEILEEPIHDGINYPEINKSINGIKDNELKEYAVTLFAPYYKRHLEYVEFWEKKNNLKWKYGS
jgi:hypothetical protein